MIKIGIYCVDKAQKKEITSMPEKGGSFHNVSEDFSTGTTS
ncbi:MAG: hypothetical protein AB7V48_17670 [Sedimentibacter sp.]